MKETIVAKENKFFAYINGIYVGSSTNRLSAKNLIKRYLRALDNEKRIKYLEKRLRKIRNKVFDFECSGINLEKVKKEIILRRKKYTYINTGKLKLALKIS